MFNKKRISQIILTTILSLSTIQLAFADTNANVQEIAITNENTKSENLEDLSIQKLTEARDKAIDKNLEYLNNFAETTIQSIQDRKDEILNSDFGLVAFFNEKYSDLAEKDKLVEQIKLIEYLTSTNQIMYPAGSYFNVANKDYQLSKYLLQNGEGSDTTSYENLKFISNNLEDASNSIDYGVKDILETIDPSIKTLLSQDQKLSLDNELEKISSDDSVNTEIKDEIKELQGESNIVKSESNEISLRTAAPSLRTAAPSLRTTASSYRVNSLNYARKHGYTNGYYGSTNRHNNAPSPYYNFQKDGYGDCANFVSQCLRAGGVTFWENGTNDNNKWFYYSTNNRSPSWAGALKFKQHWANRVDSQTLKVSNTLNFLRPATPVAICNDNGEASHILITTDKHSNGSNFSYAAHSDEGKRTNLLQKLSGLKITYFKVYW